MDKYLAESFIFDYKSEEIQELIKEFNTYELSDKEKAIALYNKIRDGWYYKPDHISFNPDFLKSSNIYKKPYGHCIDKSVLLVSGLRGLGIPARLHLAKVKNHIAVESLTEWLGTNELTPHGMVDIYLDGKWLKASPAFNKELCIKCKVDPLDFDGENDSLFQEYDKEDNQFMEYIEDYGSFDDIPVEFMMENMRAHYPKLMESMEANKEFRL